MKKEGGQEPTAQVVMLPYDSWLGPPQVVSLRPLPVPAQCGTCKAIAPDWDRPIDGRDALHLGTDDALCFGQPEAVLTHLTA